MDRQAWLDERRAATRAAYDAEAPGYDADDYPHDAQVRYVARVLERCGPGALVLDAPCGTGRYFGQIAAAGCHVVGVDQSAGMLAEAGARGIAGRLVNLGLQELAHADGFEDAFDAVITVDAMEHVPPEDWPGVLANLRRAMRPGAVLYLTVEESADEAAKDAAFDGLRARGLPVERGEVIEGDVATYHFYPTRERVRDWLAEAGLDVVEEAYVHAEADWGYRHFLLEPARGATVGTKVEQA